MRTGEVPKQDRGLARWMPVAAVALVVVAAFAAVAAAERTTVQSGTVEMTFGADLSPRKLPGAGRAPIAFSVRGSIGTVDGSNPPPLRTLAIGLDRASRIDGSGLPRCESGLTAQVLLPISEIKERCRSAVVGGGELGLVIIFAGDMPIPATSEVVVFNAEAGSKADFYAYAQISAPVVSTIVMPIEIRRRATGRIGTEAIVTAPRIAGGSGSITDLSLSLRRRVGTRSKRDGAISLACPDGKFLVKVRAEFDDGTAMRAALPQACRSEAKLAK